MKRASASLVWWKCVPLAFRVMKETISFGDQSVAGLNFINVLGIRAGAVTRAGWNRTAFRLRAC